MTDHSLQTVARYYDEAYGSKAALQDVGMYLEFTRQIGGPVLEIGCGTGRILYEIAKSGVEIDGIDLSQPMLSVLHQKLKKSGLVSRVEQADMRAFALQKRYQLVTIPFRCLQHMITIEDKLSALQRAKEHLRDNGRLVFDVAFPKYESLTSGFGVEYLDSEWKSKAEGDKTVRMYFRRDGYRKHDQVMNGSLIFRVYDEGIVIREEGQPLEMHFFSLPELEACFSAVGLEVERSYGSFDFKPIDENATQMIFVLKAKRTC